jgi:hypothetical protein
MSLGQIHVSHTAIVQVLDQQRQRYAAVAAALAAAKDGAEVQRSTQGKLRQELAAVVSNNNTSR